MKITGIIAEYNPFHNGHQFHIEKAKEITGADYVVVVMSGSFTQRGIPAFADKYTRTKMALSCGADLVLELPVYYATGSAEYFAAGAIALLDKLGIIDSICFGSECGDITALTDIAHILASEPPQLQSLLQSALKSGLAYPMARHNALIQYFSHTAPEKATSYEGLLASPNNILGIEYCKALIKRSSRITPYTIRREGGAYNDASLTTLNSSALAIRTALDSDDNLAQIQNQMPASVYTLLQGIYHQKAPVRADDISLLLHYQLLLHEATGYTQFMDVSEELSNRIIKKLRYYKNFTSFCDLLKTKEITYTRISRALLHILLTITKENMELYKKQDYITYARMLGFRKDATELFSYIKQVSKASTQDDTIHPIIPLISKLADAREYLSDTALSMLTEDIKATHIYHSVIQNKFGYNLKNEYQSEVIRY